MTETIILTSAGFKVPVVAEAIIQRLPKSPENTKIAHIFTASNVATSTDYVERDREAMHKLGFQVTDITLEGKSEQELYSLLSTFDIVYMQGGNGFYLLRHMRASGFEAAMRRLLHEGVWYVGVSAGSFVCCPTIEMQNWQRMRENWYGVDDMKGMSLVPFLVAVHYQDGEYREKLAKQLPTASAPVKILTDEQAFFIQDGSIELIGQGPEVLASDVLSG